MSTHPESTHPEKDAPLGDHTTQLETQTQHLNQPFSLSERVEKIEATLLLIADVYRFQRLDELLAAGNWREADLETI